MIIGAGLEAVGIGLIVPLMGVLAADQQELGETSAVEGVMSQIPLVDIGNPLQLLLLFGGIMLLKNVFYMILTFAQAHFSFQVRFNIASRLYDRYIHESYEFHAQTNSAVLIRNIISEAGCIASGVVLPFLVIVSELLVIIALSLILVLVISSDVMITIGFLVFAAVIPYLLLKKKLDSWGEIRQDADGRVLAQLQQSFGGVKEILSSNTAGYFANIFEGAYKLTTRMTRNYLFLQSIPRSVFEMVLVCSLVLLLFLNLEEGKISSDVLPMLALFTAAAVRLAPSATRVMVSFQTMKYYFPALGLIAKELDKPIQTSDESIVNSKCSDFGRFDQLKFQNVHFHYRGKDTDVLRSMNITVEKGDIIGITGASGEGKSTLIDLILGLLKPSSGVVTINNMSLENCLHSWRHKIGFVPQSIYVLDDTLRQNIAFGISGDQISDEGIAQAVRIACLDDVVKGLPEGLETVLGERGVSLSGGQSQRVAVARAIYRNPEVLILDEATSALDSETERRLIDNIRQYSKDITVLMVAHRNSSLRYCNKFYDVRNGSAVQVES